MERDGETFPGRPQVEPGALISQLGDHGLSEIRSQHLKTESPRCPENISFLEVTRLTPGPGYIVFSISCGLKSFWCKVLTVPLKLEKQVIFSLEKALQV